jgi:hypothetical protein
MANRFGMYMYLAGKSKNSHDRRWFAIPKPVMRKKILAELAWLRANKKNLSFDGATGRFKLTGKEVKVKPPEGGEPGGPEVF